MFDAIAPRYDMLNRILSMGIDRGWRRRTVDALALGEGPAVALDVATGTGDLALAIAGRHPQAHVVGLDPSDNMLAVGRGKVAKAGMDDRVELVHGDAQDLPFDDDRFDACCIGFGIRNVPDRALALREMARVTQPGGRVAVLELGEPQGGVMGPLARFHIRTVVPRLGAALSGAREYRYLQESIAAFPAPEAFADMMRDAGMDVLEVRPLTFGVCHLYVGTPRNRGAG
jgi:demethylmenaquinone methyltransferase / 2-methoxy-6-polyprenyl-1,4-benzoquinol methylase